MKQSMLLPKTLKNRPNDADTINHALLVQAGFVRQLMAGVYTYMPMGLMVLNKISNIVREEMNNIGSNEILMPMLHPSSVWQQTGAWDNVDVLFKIKSRTERDYALGQSEEEVVTPLMKEFILSYRDMPSSVYQINWKFRDELRAKSGLMRGREFLMKDMYSWHATQEDFEEYYEIVKKAYLKIYERLGLMVKVTEASGGSFSQKISYEFMAITDAGEDDVLYCDSCEFCVNTEIAKVNEGDTCTKCNSGKLKKARASEVGNVFDLGQKYTKDFDLTFADQNSEKKHPIMGCYGFGISRVMGVLVEKFNDEKGIVWPASIAPFKVHLIELNGGKGKELYEKLTSEGIEVLWDERELGAGQKFVDSDLIGIPFRVITSEKTGDQIELKMRNEAEGKLMSINELLSAIR